MSHSYHHGDLPTALRAATATLIAEKGPSGFSLREVARRAGVSHAAPAHHFGDAQGMITSVAAEGWEALADAMTEAAADATDARDLLRRTGQAYARVATQNPGHFAVMLQKDLLRPDDEEVHQHSVRAYDLLLSVVSTVRDELNPELDVEAAATFVWSSIQGLVALSPKLGQVAEETNTSTAPLDELVERMADFMLDGLIRR